MGQRKLVVGVSVAGVAGLVLLSVGACGITTKVETDGSPVGETIRSVRLASSSGHVTIRTGGPTQVRREVHFRDNRPGRTHHVEGDVLVLDGCGQRNCWVDYDVIVPKGVALAGEVDSGDVTVEDAASVDLKSDSGDVRIARVPGRVNVAAQSGRVELVDIGDTVSVEAQSGDIRLDRVKGAATVRSSSGRVTASGMGTSADIVVTSGDIEVGLTEVGNVKARSQSGNVLVTVPQGGYRVSADTSSGDVEAGVANDPAATNFIELAATSGDVTVRYA